MNLRFIVISALLVLSTVVYGQDPIVIDEIIGKVDNYIILKSDLEKRFLEARSQGAREPEDMLKCLILEGLVNEKLMVAKAEIDSVIISEDDVTADLNRRIQYILSQYNGSEDLVLQYYGKTIEDIRLELREQIREQLTVNRMQMELTQGLTVTPSDVRKFFRKIPQDSLPFYDMEVEVAQITKVSEPGIEQKEEIRQKLIDLRARAIAGEDFGALAREYSEGPSASSGGDLGRVTKGSMVPAFERVAFTIKPGEISMPFETKFGYHIMKLEDRQGLEYSSRHIIMTPQPNQEDLDRTIELMDSIRNLILEEKITFEAAAREFSDDDLTKGAGGYFVDQMGASRLSIRDLDPAVYFAIDTISVGTVTPPSVFQTVDGKSAVRILYYKSNKQPHIANLEDDWGKLQSAALLEKQNKILFEWFEEAKNDVFINVDATYDGCKIIN